MFRIKRLKKSYLCIDCLENMWLAAVELSPEFHLWQEALHISLLNEIDV